MQKKLLLLLFAASVGAFSSQGQTLSVSLGSITVPDDHTIHLTATSTGTVFSKGFQFRHKGATAWTTTGYTGTFEANISNLTNAKWEFRAFVWGAGSADTLFSQTSIVHLDLCCEATAAIAYPPTITPSPEDICAILDGVFINGLCWARSNVNARGAFAANPEDYGMFYQWNRSVGWSTSDPMVNSNGGTTWDNSFSGGTTWETSNEVCPIGWRVPTQWDILSLLTVAKSWITSNGVDGYLFSDGSNSIFLPAVGYRHYGDGLLMSTNNGLYWSSTQYGPNDVYDLYFYNGGAAGLGGATNSNGLPVRCVAE